jgi:hypothetical protein
MQKPRLGHTDFYFSIALLIFSSLMLIEALRMPDMGDTYSNPNLLPTVIASAIIVLSGFTAIGSLRSFQEYWRGRDKTAGSWLRSINKPLVTVIAMLLLYVLVFLRFLPYPVATFVFLLALMWLFKGGALWKICLISAIASGTITYLFGSVFLIPLP